MRDEMQKRWPSLCRRMAQIIRDLHPWWFDGSEGNLGLARIQHLNAVKWMGEECSICDKNIGGQEALMATFERRLGAIQLRRVSDPETDQPDLLIFFAHPACVLEND